MNGASVTAAAPARPPGPIRKAEFADIPQLARMLADAFRDDPFIESCEPTPVATPVASCSFW